MSLPVPLHHYSYRDYIAVEEHSPVRHEFIAGEIYAMAGGTPGHAALAAMILRLVGNQLPAACRAYTSDLRVRIVDVADPPEAGGAPLRGIADVADPPEAGGAPLRGIADVADPPEAGGAPLRGIADVDVTTYPDGTVVCGPTIRAPDDPIAVTNPVLLIEVTSASTETYDRGTKLECQRLASVREVLLVSHRTPRLSLHRREADGSWTIHEGSAGDAIELASIGGRIAIDDVYRDGLEDA